MSRKSAQHVKATRRAHSGRALDKKTRRGTVREAKKDNAEVKQARAQLAAATTRQALATEAARAEHGEKIRAGMAEAKAQRDADAASVFADLNKGADFLPVAIEYAQQAVADKLGNTHGVWIRLAAKRFLADLKRASAKHPPFTFSQDDANRACRFLEGLPHVEGRWETPTLTLIPAQVFFLVNLFGFRSLTGARRFSAALLTVARKNAKSTLAAGIMLYLLCEENEPGAQLFAAATTGDQARVVWRIAKAMLERCHALQRRYDVEPWAQQITRADSNAFFRPINAKASTQDGLNPAAFVLDELHAHKTHDLMNVLTSAAGARESPLFLYTTTEGYDSPGPWAEMRAFSQSVLRGAVDADHFFPLIFSVDEDNKELGTKADDDFAENAWRKANPLYDYSPTLRTALAQYATEARAMPGKRAEFRIKRLNRQAAAARAWIDLQKWNKCGEPFDIERLRGYPCWGAFDLSSTRDMSAWALLWLVEDQFYTRVRYWVPEAEAQARTERRSAPYRSWIDSGFVTMTDGDAVDYDVIGSTIIADCQEWQPQLIAFDPWNAQQISNQLTREGLPLEMFIQGPRSYHPAMQAAEIIYTKGRLHHGGNPVLTWNAANLVPRLDVNLNMAPDKKRSADKIDGMAALLMAFGLAIRETSDDSAGFFSQYKAA